jgi:hypothetical protein
LSLRLFGLLLLRYAQRTFLSLLLNEPPRSTRVSSGCPLPQVYDPEATFFSHPPNNFPNSATIPEAWRY